LGEHNIVAGVLPSDPENDERVQRRLSEVFSRADTAEIIRAFDEAFHNRTLSLRSLFRDEQRRIANLILSDSIASSAAAYRAIYESQGPLIRFLHDLSIPVPPAWKAAAEMVINNQLRAAFERPGLDMAGIQGYLKEAATSQINLAIPALEFAVRRRVEQEAEQFEENPSSLEMAQKFRQVVDFALSLPFPVALWDAQTVLYGALAGLAQGQLRAKNGDFAAQAAWREELAHLSDRLKVVPPVGATEAADTAARAAAADGDTGAGASNRLPQ
jgi:hypothetical protein